MMANMLQTISSLHTADYQFNKVLSASAWSSLSTRIISAVSTA